MFHVLFKLYYPFWTRRTEICLAFKCKPSMAISIVAVLCLVPSPIAPSRYVLTSADCWAMFRRWQLFHISFWAAVIIAVCVQLCGPFLHASLYIIDTEFHLIIYCPLLFNIMSSCCHSSQAALVLITPKNCIESKLKTCDIHLLKLISEYAESSGQLLVRPPGLSPCPVHPSVLVCRAVLCPSLWPAVRAWQDQR